MASVSVDLARREYGGDDVHQVAALASANGFHVIVWLKKGGNWEDDQLGCCVHREAVAGYLTSEYSVSAEVVYDDGILNCSETARELFQDVPVEKPSWLEEEVSAARSRLGVPHAQVEIYSSKYPPTQPNAPFLSAWEGKAFCIVRFDLDETSHGAYLDAVREGRFRLTMATYCYPTFPLIQLVLRIHPSRFASVWFQEVIANITDGDIQSFICDACRQREWTLVLAQYDPSREKAARQMINCLETCVSLSRDEVEGFISEACTAAEHFKQIAENRRDFDAAARQLLSDNPPLDMNL